MSPETSPRLVIEGGRGRVNVNDVDQSHQPDIPCAWRDDGALALHATDFWLIVHAARRSVLRGHHAYYGIAANIWALQRVHRAVERYWRTMLTRRSWKVEVRWKAFQRVKGGLN